MYLCTFYGNSVTRYKILWNILFLLLYTVIIEITHFSKNNYHITEIYKNNYSNYWATNFIFQKNQSIPHQLTLKMKILIMINMTTTYLINVLPMNILISIIQIKLHLTTKLLQIAKSTICQIVSLLLRNWTLKVATI